MFFVFIFIRQTGVSVFILDTFCVSEPFQLPIQVNGLGSAQYSVQSLAVDGEIHHILPWMKRISVLNKSTFGGFKFHGEHLIPSISCKCWLKIKLLRVQCPVFSGKLKVQKSVSIIDKIDWD